MIRQTFPFIPLALACTTALVDLPRASAQVGRYTYQQITTDSTDHRWPAFNNNGDMVWCQQMGGFWHVFKNGAQITSGNNDRRYPAISDGGSIVYTEYGVGGGIGREVILHPDGVVEFSSRNSLTGDHRDAGEFSGIFSAGNIISYYTFFHFFSPVRRFTTSKVGQFADDFSGYDYPDVNANGDIVFSYRPIFGLEIVYRGTETTAQSQIFVANGSQPRIADRVNGADPEVVYISNGNVWSSKFGR